MPNTPAGELGLDLGPSDYTAAAWDTPHEAADAMWALTATRTHLPYMMILYMIMHMILTIMCMMCIMMFVRKWTLTTGMDPDLIG